MEDFYILDFAYMFPIFEIFSSLTLAFSDEPTSESQTEKYRWVKIFVCFTQWEAKTVIPPPSPEVPGMLRANTAFSSEGISGGGPASSQEKKDEGNISERGCARDHTGRVWEWERGMRQDQVKGCAEQLRERILTLTDDIGVNLQW